jgi:glycosyltransferase involved in cell wall biosynthesis
LFEGLLRSGYSFSMSVDILVPVRKGYVYFRQLYESICHKIPKEEIGNIIVVDDHSSDKLLITYTQYLQQNNFITLIRNGIPLPSYYSGIPLSFLKSKGHGGSRHIGLKHVTSDYVLMIDPDCIILRGDIIKNSLPCFDLDPQVMSVGQVVGTVKGVKVIGEEERKNPELNTAYVRKRPQDYGVTNAVCMLSKMDSWRLQNLDTFCNAGWAHATYLKSLFEKGFKTCNFDYFVNGYVIYLGKAILSKMRFKWMKYRRKKHLSPYGMSVEDTSYSAKNSGETYAGYLELKIPNEEYKTCLDDTYLNLPLMS